MIQQQIQRPDGATVSFTLYPAARETAAPVLVYIPGWLCTAGSWDGAAVSLSKTFTGVTLDLPGFGRSLAGNRQDWSLENYGKDVIAVINAIGAKTAVLVGHSMGGAVAMEAALSAPERVSHLIAVDSLIHAAFYDRTPEGEIEPIVAAFAGDFAAAVQAAMQAYVLSTSSSGAHKAVAAMGRANPARGLAVLREFLRWDVEQRLKLLRSPLSLLVADAFLDDAIRSRWQKRYPFVAIEGAGHFLMLDQPEGFERAIRGLLA